ncbi:MAG: GEVED domain-containing protein, partial [Candidatus Sericytochromatia bacterium]
SYGTLDSSFGASHNVSSNLKIGTNAGDADSNGFFDGIDNNANATDDDLSGTDDEDSISSFPSLTTGSLTYSINALNVSNSTGGTANLRGWIDFDRNGIFDDDEASSLETVPTGTSNQTYALTWPSLPNDTQAGTSYVRIRISTDNLGVTQDIGNKLDGEVEDYQLTIVQSADYGDAPDSYFTTSASNNGGARHKLPSTNLYLGTNLTDENSNGTAGTSANSDDTTGNDDEDSISIFPALTNASKTYTLAIKATNTTGIPANLRGWIDFDGNGTFDSDESATVSVPTGTNGTDVNLTWSSVPSDIAIGNSFLRLRYTTDTLPATDVSGEKSNGEVEDYPISIIQATDFGDAPNTSFSTILPNGARHNITRTLYMGATWADHDSDGQPNATATGDDTNGDDDEESISSFSTLATHLSTYSVSTTLTNSSGANAFLRAWIDFDGNNVFDDDEASDLVTVPNNTTNIATNITWSTIPNDISVGTSRYVRVRLSTQTLAVTDDIGLKSGGE